MIESSWWVAWLVIVAASFGVLEGVALFNKKEGDTLSENTRRWIGMVPDSKTQKGGVAVFAATVIGFAVWFVVHILGG